ncbi:hypothetical protein VP1G_00320 [Cytospora mali]|uniref:SMP-30/Gluconolactonase/LRE-like region domain-containing protein n=1 Tax=Cytospora mali TaxID=578113 RepID=A0A194UMQ7_CYTMA|nr:hypothetical protein VP1G_00320 [Valsa mali var. pyri (nom. inval.)]
MSPSLLRTLITALTATLAVSATPCPTTNLLVTVLHSFGYPSWLENLAIRSNGEILTTRLDTPILYQVNHLTGTPVEIATWNGSQWGGCLGIAEGKADKFYVILAALYNQETFVKTGGVNAVFEVDMSTFLLAADGTTVKRNATVSHITDIPEADYLNGMATLDNSHIYVADVYSGTVYLIDVDTGNYTLAVNDPLMKWTVDGDSAPTHLGSNGLKMHGGYLYWSNTAGGFIARIKVGSDGLPVGESSIVVANVARPDDFQVRSDGTVFIAQNQVDTLSVAFPEARGDASVNATAIAGSDVSTVLAALALPINGTVTVAGTISYVDIDF